MAARRAALSFAVFLSLAVPGTSLFGGEAASLSGENAFLEAELSLAAGPNIYLVFDLPGRSVLIKARGVTLSAIPVERAAIEGRPVTVGPHALLGKEVVLLPPRRSNIKPGGQGGGDGFKVKALELEDMPSAYGLYLDGNIAIQVSPSGGDFASTMKSLQSFVLERLLLPVMNPAEPLLESRFSVIRMKLDYADAQSLYWSFLEGSKCLVLAGDAPPE